MENVKDFIIDYIQKEYTIPDDIDIINLNFVEEGYVDSLGLVQFIYTIEDEFGISFSDDDLQNPDIKVVGKLIAIVESKMEAGKQ
ncbi:MAG: acyl carrier protein [Clostridia bacterium]|nr:acyl carrier protein [Clostridia bacterium]